MTKTIYYCVALLVIACSVFIMTGGEIMKKSWYEADNVVGYADHLDTALKQQDWPQAQLEHAALSRAWKHVMPRIQFSVEKDEMNAINTNLARIQAYILCQDQTGALAETSELRDHWINLAK